MPVPADQRRGDGPRRTGVVGALAGSVGARRRAVHALGAAGWGLPWSQGAMQQMGDRGSEAIMPHDTARGEGARTARVHDIAAPSWRPGGARRWRGVRAKPRVASWLKDVYKTGEAFHDDEAQKSNAKNKFWKLNCQLIGK